MPIDYSPTTQDGLSLIVQNYNLNIAGQNQQLSDNYDFDLPATNALVTKPGNTVLVARANIYNDLYGVVKIYYNRMDLSSMLGVVNLRAPVNTPIVDVLPFINAAYGINLVEQDVIIRRTPYSTGVFLLQVRNSSYLFTGSASIYFTPDTSITAARLAEQVAFIAWRPVPNSYNGSPSNTVLYIDFSPISPANTPVVISLDWVPTNPLGAAPTVTMDTALPPTFARIDFLENATILAPGVATFTISVNSVPNTSNQLTVVVDEAADRISTYSLYPPPAQPYALGDILLFESFENTGTTTIPNSNLHAQVSLIPQEVWQDANRSGGSLESARLALPSLGLTAKESNPQATEIFYLAKQNPANLSQYLFHLEEQSIVNLPIWLEWEFEVLSDYHDQSLQLMSLVICEGTNAKVVIQKLENGLLTISIDSPLSAGAQMKMPFLAGQYFYGLLQVEDGAQQLYISEFKMHAAVSTTQPINFSGLVCNIAKQTVLKNIKVSVATIHVPLESRSAIALYAGWYSPAGVLSGTGFNSDIAAYDKFGPYAVSGNNTIAVQLGPILSGNTTLMEPLCVYYPVPSLDPFPDYPGTNAPVFYEWAFDWTGNPAKTPTVSIIPRALPEPQKVIVTITTYLDGSDISGILTIAIKRNGVVDDARPLKLRVDVNPLASGDTNYWRVTKGYPGVHGLT